MIEFFPLTEDDLPFLNEVRNECCAVYLHNSNKFALYQTIEWFNTTHPRFWIIKLDGERVGYFRTSNHSVENKNIYLGADLHKDFRGKGIAYQSYVIFIPYLFDLLGLHKISLEVLATNERAINLYKKLGFEVEGIKRDEVFKNGTWVNSIIMSIFNNSTHKITIPDEYWTGNGLLENECPWLTPGAITRLMEIDMSDMDVLEFGAGGSTIFFSRRARSVTSLEQSEEWFKKIMDEVTKKKLNNVHLCSNFDEIDINRHYGLILIDSAGDRKEILNLVGNLYDDDTIIVIDNYSEYNMIVYGAKVELYDDDKWNGLGTMVIYPK